MGNLCNCENSPNQAKQSVVSPRVIGSIHVIMKKSPKQRLAAILIINSLS